MTTVSPLTTNTALTTPYSPAPLAPAPTNPYAAQPPVAAAPPQPENAIGAVLGQIVSALEAIVSQLAALLGVGGSSGDGASSASPAVSSPIPSGTPSLESDGGPSLLEKATALFSSEDGASFADTVSGYYEDTLDAVGRDSWLGKGISTVGGWIGSAYSAIASFF